jgi:TldD protein
MNMMDPMVQRLAVAQSTLLEPASLKQSDLRRALACIAEHRVDDADLYFQYTRSEAWSLDEGIVKSGSFSIDQGLGVRAVHGEKSAFSYSDGISEAILYCPSGRRDSGENQSKNATCENCAALRFC